MFDARISSWLKIPLSRVGTSLVTRGWSADQMTWLGAGFGALAVIAVSLDATLVGLMLFLLNRLCDGLDGAIARCGQPSDAGAFLDIVIDFWVYAGMVVGFAIRDPSDSLAATILLFSFIGTASSFLAFAVFAKSQGLTNLRMQRKSMYYLEGLTEGFETTCVFAVMCLFPAYFSVMAYGFAVLCVLTALGRIYEGRRRLHGNSPVDPDTL